jgi:hypothetical protein
MKSSFLERKLERKADNVKKKRKKRTSEEDSIFLVGGILSGYRDAFPIFKHVQTFLINEEKRSGKEIWEMISEEDREVLLKKTKELKSFLTAIEEKAKNSKKD